jgi:DNA polymerase-1
VYKTGAKVGEVRYKVLVKEYELPQLVKPLKGSETKKEGYWKVNDDILRQLKLSKEAKKIVELISKYSELDKLRGTYLLGWSNLIDTMNWEKDMIHGNLNMCVAATGRLSSTKPNLQNADPLTKEFMESRYE